MTLVDYAHNSYDRAGREVEELALMHFSNVSKLYSQASSEARNSYRESFSKVTSDFMKGWKSLLDNPSIDNSLLRRNFIFVHEILNYFYRKNRFDKLEYWKAAFDEDWMNVL